LAVALRGTRIRYLASPRPTPGYSPQRLPAMTEAAVTMAESGKTVELIRFSPVTECTIIKRRNRFIVLVELDDGTLVDVHNTNTGRLIDVLVRGRRAFCIRTLRPRKTSLRLLAVEYRQGYALIDTRSQEEAVRNAIDRGVLSWLPRCKTRKRHVKIGSSRIDFLLDCGGREAYMEMKSAILATDDGGALYPDAPSPRGRRHVKELIKLRIRGVMVYLLFVAAFSAASYFMPNRDVDPEMADLIAEAARRGVAVHAVGIDFDPRSMAARLYSDRLRVMLA